MSNSISSYLSSISDSGSTGTSSQGIFSSWESLNAYLQANQVPIFFGMLALAVVLCFLAIWNKHRHRKAPNLVKSDSVGPFTRYTCIFLILGLVFSDFPSLQNMFRNFGMTYRERRLFSITFALFLEGFPVVLGIALPKVLDPAQPYARKRGLYAFISAFSLAAILVTFALSVVLRLEYTEQPSRGGLDAFLAGNYDSGGVLNKSDRYLGEVFLFFSPILTSVMAFLVTLVVLGNTNMDDAAKRCQRNMERFQWFKARCDKANHKRDDASSSLWYTLGHSVNDPIPVAFSDYRKACHVKIHSMIINNCLYAYPSLLKRYNDRVEATLGYYINELARLSSIPNVITKIKVEDIILDYDTHVDLDVDAWNYERCEPVMCGDLERLLNSAVIMAQFKHASKKYKSEKEW